MIPDSHPYWHVRDIVLNRSDVQHVPASYYTYLPQTVAESRTEWLIKSADFLEPEFMENLLESTPTGQEMAVHSDLRLEGGGSAHLVMVDMATASKAHLEKLRVFLGDHFFREIAWFTSGRSFHGYGQSLLPKDDWVKFMGLLLLANKPRLEATVDPRWIGHRLMAGYAALRWTINTDHYLKPPTRIQMVPRSGGPSIDVGPIGKQVGSLQQK